MKVAPNYKDIGKRMRNIPMLVDLDVRFRVMDRFDDYEQVLSLPTPPIEVFASPADAIDLAQAANDGMAELVRKHPDRFPGFVASLPLNDPEASLRGAASRGRRSWARAAFQIFSNICGRPISAPEFLPLFEAMAGYDLPIWLHPFRGADFSDYATEDRSQYEIWWTFGWPYDTSVAMARLVFAGLLRSLSEPEDHHAPHGRDGAVLRGPDRPGLGSARRAHVGRRTTRLVLKALTKRPLDYFKMFYADTALFGAYDATVCGLRFFGADHVVFASDAPFDPEKGPMYIRETIAIVDRLPIDRRRSRADLLAQRRGVVEVEMRSLLRVFVFSWLPLSHETMTPC